MALLPLGPGSIPSHPHYLQSALWSFPTGAYVHNFGLSTQFSEIAPSCCTRLSRMDSGVLKALAVALSESGWMWCSGHFMWKPISALVHICYFSSLEPIKASSSVLLIAQRCPFPLGMGSIFLFFFFYTPFLIPFNLLRYYTMYLAHSLTARGDCSY